MRSTKLVSGFVMMEVMISVVIVSILLASIMTAAESGTKATKQVELTGLRDEILTEVRMVVRNRDTCTAALKYTDPATGTSAPARFSTTQSRINEISLGSSSIAKVGEVIDGIEVADLALSEVDPALRRINFPNPGETTYYVSLDLTLYKTEAQAKSSYGGAELQTRPIRFYISSDDASGDIRSCYGMGIDPMDLCAQMGSGWVWNAGSSRCMPPADPTSREQLCTSIGGSWDAVNSRCVLNPGGTLTPTINYPACIDTDVVWNSLGQWRQCPANHVLVGAKARGSDSGEWDRMRCCPFN